MKTTIKRIISCFLFITLVVVLVVRANQVVLNKEYNRYYYLEDFIEQENENYTIQAYGSCHTYTSFDAPYIEETYGVSTYVFANPAEIIPITYLRMCERFKTDIPKVVVLDIWGLNGYDTYLSKKDLFEKYMAVNVELLPLSKEKIELINDYEYLDIINENFPISKYKDRVLEMEITNVDYAYSFDLVALGDSVHPDGYINFIMKEMEVRKNSNGFSRLDHKKETKDLHDYSEKQAHVDSSQTLPYEEDMLKYLEKIITLCEDNGVKLVFYRSPYIANENEMKKTNWFANYCRERNIPYYDLEREVEFNYSTDFQDEWHLNELGARKATEYLSSKIISLLD